MVQNEVSVIIPSYQPDDKLVETVRLLSGMGFDDIIVVNDGSSAECLKYFEGVKKFPGCTVLSHFSNQGKGAALKTAFGYFLESRPDRRGVVTADGDAQHTAVDIMKCASEMVSGSPALILGVRNFKTSNVPLRSRLGNNITAFVLKSFCRVSVSDTQTGLRAIPSEYVADIMKIDGDRYEFETNMLIEAKRLGISIREVGITTVYLENNATSHFKTLSDSAKIYKLIVKSMKTAGKGHKK